MENRLITNKKITEYSVLLIGFTLPFAILFNNISIILFSLITLTSVDFWKNLKYSFSKRYLIFLIPVTFYLLHLLGLLYTENFKEAFFDLEKKLSLVLFPLFIILNYRIDNSLIHKTVLAFIYACYIIVVICFVHAVYFSAVYDKFTIENFTRDSLLTPVQEFIHPTDLTTYSAFSSAVISFTLFRNSMETGKRIILIIINLTFVAAIILLGSRTPLAAYLVVLFVTTGYYIFNSFNSKILPAFVLIITASLVIFLLFQVDIIKNRFEEIIYDSSELPYGAHHNSTNLRKANVLCSWEVIKSNFFIGTGTGDVQKELNKCYYSHGLSSVLYRDSYNAHNQYLQTFATLGLFGFLNLLLLFLVIIYKSVVKKYFYGFVFIVLVFFCAVTESLFGHQKGIIFFSFFFSLFACSLFPLNNNNQNFNEGSL